MPVFGRSHVQDAGLPCQFPECPTLVVWRGSGRKPRFCSEHQSGKYAKARQRTRDAEPREARPTCCESAGRRGGRISCAQHKAEPLGIVGPGAKEDDYAGQEPRRVLRQDVEPDSAALHRGSELAKGSEREGFRAWGSRGVDHLRLTEQSMTECHTHNGARIRVIGQPDLTAGWQPYRERKNPMHKPLKPSEKARPVEGLVSRGDDWPWADEIPEGVAA